MSERNASGIAWPIQAQRVYVNMKTGEIALFDSFARWPYLGIYRLSSKKTIRMRVEEMRHATPQEQERFARAKKAGVEATSWASSNPGEARRRPHA